MIIKTYINKNLYGKYFLATEAPDDEEVTEEQPKPKRNVKVISVKRSNRGKDFAAETDEEETPVEEPTPEETTEPVEDAEDNADFAVDTDTAEEETPAEEPTTEETPTEETPAEEPTAEETNENQDFAADTDATEETPPAEEAPVDEPVEDTTDFAADTDTAEEATPTEETPPATDANATANANNAPGVELDSMRKYNLFKEFMSLYNACDNYISKLETVLKNDYEENQIIRICVNNLREIKDILSDYMTIRFRLNSYIQSLLFHQKMVAAVQLIFNMLRSANSNSKTSNSK
jgi:chemotaxis protein histidine kinase CheA